MIKTIFLKLKKIKNLFHKAKGIELDDWNSLELLWKGNNSFSCEFNAVLNKII